jgi:C-terminal processing protease CtpA/Prc
MIITKQIQVLLLILIIASCKSTKKFNESVTKVHSREELIEDINFLVNQLERYHPRLYDYTTEEEFHKKVDLYKKGIKPMTSQEFFVYVYPLVSEIRQGHLALRPVFPRRDRRDRKRYRKATNQFNDIDFKWIEDGIYVENTYGELDSLLVGSRLINIDSLNADKLLNRWKKMVTSDGYNTTFQPHLVAENILGFYRYDVGRTDSIALELKKGDSLFSTQLKIVFRDEKKSEKDSTQNDSLKNEPVKLTKAEKKKKKHEDKKRRRDEMKRGYNSRTQQNTREFRLMGKDSSIAYLRIRSFEGWYKWSKRFYRESFAKIDSLGSKHLILDLRDNTGGSLKEIGEIYGFLAEDNFTFINPMETKTRFVVTSSMWSGEPTFTGHFFRAIATPVTFTYDLIRSKKENETLYYKSKFGKEREPKETAFEGEIFVLINGLSFSASSILSTNLYGSKRATFIGEETGGAFNGTVAGLYQSKFLPNSKLFLPLWLMNLDATYKTKQNGYGIQPDVLLLPRLEDFLKDKDTVLEWTIETIESNM